MSHDIFSLYHHSGLICLDCFSVMYIAIVWKPPCELKSIFVLTITESRANIWLQRCIPPPQ